jgi:hypothetical protein
MSVVQKFKAGDFIIWDRIKWLVLNTDNNLYELKLVNAKQFTTKHGNGGYMSSVLIDETATLFEILTTNGGLKRSRKNRRSINRRRNSVTHQ